MVILPQLRDTSTRWSRVTTQILYLSIDHGNVLVYPTRKLLFFFFTGERIRMSSLWPRRNVKTNKMVGQRLSIFVALWRYLSPQSTQLIPNHHTQAWPKMNPPVWPFGGPAGPSSYYDSCWTFCEWRTREKICSNVPWLKRVRSVWKIWMNVHSVKNPTMSSSYCFPMACVDKCRLHARQEDFETDDFCIGIPPALRVAHISRAAERSHGRIHLGSCLCMMIRYQLCALWREISSKGNEDAQTLTYHFVRFDVASWSQRRHTYPLPRKKKKQ
jgi:hypothetical protein